MYFLNAMAKEGGALDRGKPGTVAPGYAFEGGKREYGRVRGDSPLRKLQRPLIVPEVDYPGVPDSRLQDVVVAEALALFRAWSNRNKPRFFDYKLSKPMTGDSPEVEELMELYRNHNRRFMRIHQLVAENNETRPIYFDPKKGKLPIGTQGIQTGITITPSASNVDLPQVAEESRCIVDDVHELCRETRFNAQPCRYAFNGFHIRKTVGSVGDSSR